jgi:hypothetical protein
MTSWNRYVTRLSVSIAMRSFGQANKRGARLCPPSGRRAVAENGIGPERHGYEQQADEDSGGGGRSGEVPIELSGNHWLPPRPGPGYPVRGPGPGIAASGYRPAARCGRPTVKAQATRNSPLLATRPVAPSPLAPRDVV